MDEIEKFATERKQRISEYESDAELQKSGAQFLQKSVKSLYSYNFSWMGRPIIQYPQDMIAMQELIWDIKPDVIVETGVAHGGSLIYYASLFEMMGIDGIVIGIDIDIRSHNKTEIESHMLSHRIEMIEGSSIDSAVVERVQAKIDGSKKVLVCLDSNHTHDHVLKELELYSPMVSVGSYCVVFDTLIENMSDDSYPERSWGVGNNPMTAVKEFLKENREFVIDKEIDNKLIVSVAPEGYLKREK